MNLRDKIRSHILAAFDDMEHGLVEEFEQIVNDASLDAMEEIMYELNHLEDNNQELNGWVRKMKGLPHPPTAGGQMRTYAEVKALYDEALDDFIYHTPNSDPLFKIKQVKLNVLRWVLKLEIPQQR